MASEDTVVTHDETQEAQTLLAQGKRHLLVRDYTEAVTSLALACEYFAKIYGDSANECAEPLFHYGKALLELARIENGVLGMEDKEGSEKDDESEEADNKASKENGEESGDTNDSTVADEQKHEGKDSENGSGADSTVSETKLVKVGGEDTAGDTATSSGVSAINGETATNEEQKTEGVDSEEDEDDISNLHLAWEMFELVKVIYQRQAESDHTLDLKLAEVYLKLGEVALESENYMEATEDMNNCLRLQEQHLQSDDRCIAETYYQIGIAYSLANQFDDAISAFAKAGKLLELRVSNLKDKIKAAIKPDSSDPFYTFEGEIEELQKLFPEIKEKIFDMQDFKNETMKAMMSHRTNGSGSDAGAGSSKDIPVAPASAFGASSSSSSDAKPVSNIGHLVRKKRKSESEGNEAVSQDQKRVCTSNEDSPEK